MEFVHINSNNVVFTVTAAQNELIRCQHILSYFSQKLFKEKRVSHSRYDTSKGSFFKDEYLDQVLIEEPNLFMEVHELRIYLRFQGPRKDFRVQVRNFPATLELAPGLNAKCEVKYFKNKHPREYFKRRLDSLYEVSKESFFLSPLLLPQSGTESQIFVKSDPKIEFELYQNEVPLIAKYDHYLDNFELPPQTPQVKLEYLIKYPLFFSFSKLTCRYEFETKKEEELAEDP